MAFDPAKAFIGYDKQAPLVNSGLSSGEVLENENQLSVLNRGSQEPVTPAQLRGDTRKFPMNLTSTAKLRVKIDSGSWTEIDVTTGMSPSSVTLAHIVSRINTVLGGTYAYAFDGYLLIRSTNTTPTASSVSIDTVQGAGGDAKEKILALAKRGVTSYPYVVNGATPATGRRWWETPSATPEVEQRIQARIDRPARIQGKGLGNFNLTYNKFIKLTVDATGPLVIDVSTGGASGVNARTLADIVAKINSDMSATVAYATATGLLIQGASPDPGVGLVKLERPSSSGFSDATAIIFGMGSLGTKGKARNLYPLQDTAVSWQANWMRGVEDHPGVGLWGPPVLTKALLPAAGIRDGDTRLVLASGIAYRWDALAAAWVPFAPAGGSHVGFDSTLEAYALQHTQPQVYGYLTAESSAGIVASDVRVGQVPELVDTKREDFPATTSAGVSLARAKDFRDNFARGNASTLGTSSAGEAWDQKVLSGNGLTIASSKGQLDDNPGGADYATLGGNFGTDVNVAAKVSKDASTDPDATACEAGLLFKATDKDNAYIVYVTDRGQCFIVLRTAGVDGAPAEIGSVAVDPSLDAVERVLRVRVKSDNTIEVYWNGSLDPTDWAAYEGTTSRYYVGAASIANLGSKVGIYAKAVNGTSKVVKFGAFAARSMASADADLPGLPPIPGNKLRHIITAVQNPSDPAIAGGVVTDCTPDKPLLLDDRAGEGGVLITQTTASRKFEFRLGGPAGQMMLLGLSVHHGTTDGTKVDDRDSARFTTAPGGAVLPIGGDVNGPDSFQMRYLAERFTIGLNGSLEGPSGLFQAPIGQSSPTANRFYYAYATPHNMDPDLLVVNYSLSAPDRFGLLWQDNTWHRFLGSFFFDFPRIRGFYRSGQFQRYTRPTGTITGLTNSGVLLFNNNDVGTSYDNFNLFDTGTAPKKCVPKTANMVVVVLSTQDSGYLYFRTDTNQGNEDLLAVTDEDDGEYTLAFGPTGIVKAKKDSGTTVGAAVIGFYEDALSLPPWL